MATEAQLSQAIAIASEAHKGQFDKGGVAYILHPLEVMRMVRPDRDAMIVAVLHDVLEDCPKDRGAEFALLVQNFGPRIQTAVLTLTHRQGESYDDYIERIAGNDLARLVKIKDLTHNMDPRRIPAGEIVDKDFKRWDKYRRALIRLERLD